MTIRISWVSILFFLNLIVTKIFAGPYWNLDKTKEGLLMLSGPCSEISEKISFIRHESFRAGTPLGQFPEILNIKNGMCIANLNNSISLKFFNKVDRDLLDYRPKLSLTRDEKERLILSGENCDQVLQEANNLSTWKARLDGSEKSELPDAIKANNVCKLDVTDYVPKFILKFHDTNSIYLGPNCYNFALVVAGLLPSLKPTSNDEFGSFIHSPLCQKIQGSEQLRAGDIGVYNYKSPNTGKVKFEHGFIYISDKLVLSKNDQGTPSPYSVQETEIMYKQQYEGENFFTEYYRCMSFDEFVKDNGPTLSRDVLELSKKVDDFECDFSNLFFNRALSEIAMKNLVDTFAILDAVLKEEKMKYEKKQPNEANLIILNTLEQRLKTFNNLYLKGIEWRARQKNFIYDPTLNIRIVQYGYDSSKGKAIIVLPTSPPLHIPYRIEKQKQ